MAIAVDATSSSGEKIGVSSSTHSHTTAGTNTIIVVCTGTRGLKSNSNTTITGITYNAVALTKIRSDSSDGTAGDDDYRNRSELWYLIAPTAGANNVVVTWTGSMTTAGVGAITLTGVVQGTGAIDAHNGAGYNTDTTPDTSVTVVATGCYLIDAIYSRHDALTKDASQTAIALIPTNSNGDDMGSSYKVSPGTGAQTMAWTTGAEESCISAVSIAPYVEAGTAVMDVIGYGGVIPFAR